MYTARWFELVIRQAGWWLRIGWDCRWNKESRSPILKYIPPSTERYYLSCCGWLLIDQAVQINRIYLIWLMDSWKYIRSLNCVSSSKTLLFFFRSIKNSCCYWVLSIVLFLGLLAIILAVCSWKLRLCGELFRGNELLVGEWLLSGWLLRCFIAGRFVFGSWKCLFIFFSFRFLRYCWRWFSFFFQFTFIFHWSGNSWQFIFFDIESWHCLPFWGEKISWFWYLWWWRYFVWIYLLLSLLLNSLKVLVRGIGIFVFL